MTLIGEIRRVPAASKHSGRNRTKCYLLLRCDTCGKEFERGTGNLSNLRMRPRHFCGAECHSMSMKRGGASDDSRRTSCQEKYGADYYICIPEVASRSGKLGHTPTCEAKRKATNKVNMENYSIRLRRGLSLCRSKAEIDFLSQLAIELGDDLEYQKYVNGWWIDAYSSKFDCWIQFDGVYWHSQLDNRIRDKEQREWFELNRLRLYRITDIESKELDAVKLFAESIRQAVAQAMY